MVARRYEFCSTGVEKYSTSERIKSSESQFQSISSHFWASLSVSLNVGYNFLYFEQNGCLECRSILDLLLLCCLWCQQLQGVGGGGNSGNSGNIITGFIFDREITTRDILIRDFAFYSCWAFTTIALVTISFQHVIDRLELFGLVLLCLLFQFLNRQTKKINTQNSS